MSAVGDAVIELARRVCEPAGLAVLGDSSFPTFRRTEFRWRWMFTRLHTFVYVVELSTTTPEQVVAIAEGARAWARDHKGGLPRGLQTGAAAMPVFIVPEVGELRSWAQAPQPLRFALPLFPIVVGVHGDDAAYRTTSQRWGIIYESFFRGLADQFITAARGAA